MRLAYWRAILKRIFKQTNQRLIRIFLRSLIDGQTPDVRIIDGIIEDARRKAARATEQLAKIKFTSIVKSKEQSLIPLRAYLNERNRITEFMLKSYSKKILEESANLISLSDKIGGNSGMPGVSIGRRRNDVFREIGLKNLEKSFLRGSPTALGDKLILSDLRKNSKIFDSQGNMVLSVRTRNPLTGQMDYIGKTRAYSPEHYSEMVSLATVQEMDVVGNVENAKEMGTRLLKWNTTGKSRSQYIKENDPRCAAVDNQYCTYVEGGIRIGRRRIPHIKELLPGPFSIPHPYCRHTLKPVPESVLEAA